MTQVIITTRTAEEMRKILALAKKNNVEFEYLPIKKKTKTDITAIGKDSLTDEEHLDQGLAMMMDQGRTGEYVDADTVIALIRSRCK
ncbi:MAG: hypothetical protein NTU44_09720 [Bacteroidetes bacterium]|nr:hypothetical protein [Bacteroidota bacterium]